MKKSEKTTPMMEQYLAIKAKHQDAVLFFRLGDFYEMFFDDARIASEVLGLTLTARGHGKATKVPLAGFPYHALDNYLAKMIKAGYRVAICDQVEDPKTAKSVVKRDVTEVVSPGTVMSEDLLESKRNNYLASVYLIGDLCGFSLVDITTGEFSVMEIPADILADELAKAGAAEVLISEEQAQFIRNKIGQSEEYFITQREDWVFSFDYAYESLTKHFGTLSLKGFGCDDLTAGVCAAGAIMYFLKEVKKDRLAYIGQLQRRSGDQYLSIDSDTRRNLELLSSMRAGARAGTLISVIDKTRTPMGGRRLVQWMLNPLVNADDIRARHDAVEEFLQSADTLEAVQEKMAGVGDLERLMARIVANRATARDLVALKRSLLLVPEVQVALSRTESRLLCEIRDSLDHIETLAREIEEALVDEPPLSVTDGGLIKRGYHAELDDLRDISFSGKDWIVRLQNQERERTGIPSLKVSFNKVFGYYIEVTKPNLAKVPQHYIRKQTLVNAERFITPELKEYEEKVLDAEERIVAIEYELFDELRKHAAAEAGRVQSNAYWISALDCLASLARLAGDNHYARPEIDNGTAIEIVDGRHPVVERLLPYGEKFIPNDTHVDTEDAQVIILTGPNMAGKSTFLRQVGLIVLLAQMGSFVPAKSAKLGVVDKIFTRVGASDNLAGGESTFLVEMNETANILNNATPRSLILLDEIGRGTSTFDGLSIAWSVAEYLHNTPHVAAKSIFATHYHELTELALVLPRVRNYNVVVKEWGDKVVFLRKIAEGGCDHSYGIQVARLAGLPESVIRRAGEILANLEAKELTANNLPRLSARANGSTQPAEGQLDIFDKRDSLLIQALTEIDLDGVTPLQALNKLNDLKKLVEDNDLGLG